MPCIRNTRKKLTTIHKKMRDLLTKHKKHTISLIKYTKKYINLTEKEDVIVKLMEELESIQIPETCKEYSYKLNEKLDLMSHSLIEHNDTLKINAEKLIKLYE